MNCPHVNACELYPRFRLGSTTRLWQIKYCESDFKRCARYQLSLAGKPVPLTLLPNGQELQLRKLGG